jgi:acetyl esterase/lipase
MYDLNRVNRELVPTVQQLLELIGDSINQDNLASARQMQSSLVDTVLADLPDCPGMAVSRRSIEGPADNPELSVFIYQPTGATKPTSALLWIHGGGMILGRADQDEPLLRILCQKLQCVVVSVEYRLAPENPYPAPIDDCYAALEWMALNHREIDIDPQRIAIGGASAGAGLAAGTALLARDRGQIPLSAQVLIYPMIDDTNIAPADKDNPDTLIWNRASNRFGWSAYLENKAGGDEVHCYAAPFRADNFAGLSSTFVAVGDIDLFLDECLSYSTRLLAEGIPTELHVYPGAVHGFLTSVLDCSLSRHCIDGMCQHLTTAFETSPQD